MPSLLRLLLLLLSWLPVYKSIATLIQILRIRRWQLSLMKLNCVYAVVAPLKLPALKWAGIATAKRYFYCRVQWPATQSRPQQTRTHTQTHTQTLSLSVLLCRANSAEWRNDWKPPHRQTNCPTDWLTDGLTNLGICFCVTRQTLTVTVSVSVCFGVC